MGCLAKISDSHLLSDSRGECGGGVVSAEIFRMGVGGFNIYFVPTLYGFDTHSRRFDGDVSLLRT